MLQIWSFKFSRPFQWEKFEISATLISTKVKLVAAPGLFNQSSYNSLVMILQKPRYDALSIDFFGQN